MLRVAALQFAVQPHAERNLTSCLTLIECAAREHGAKLIVLPEFSHHVAVGEERAQQVAVAMEGPFLSALRAACGQFDVHLVVGVSLQTDEQVTSSALLFAPDGALLARWDGQNFRSDLAESDGPGVSPALVVQTEIGQLGLCLGRDLASMETVRALAVGGAELVCALFAPESGSEMAVHLAARAAESRVFLVGAGAPAASSEVTTGPGPSQIVAPDGRLLATARDCGEAIIVADLALELARDKLLPDGTDIFALRRSELFRPLPGKVVRDRGGEADHGEPLEVAVLCAVDAGSTEGAIESVASFVRELAQQGVELVVLPELFCFEGGQVVDADAAADWFQPAVRRLAEACAGTGTHVVTSLVERTQAGFGHVGVVVGHAGVVARAGQQHVPPRHAWASPAVRFGLLPLPWGKVGILVGEDALVPEAVGALSLRGAELLVAPLGLGEPAGVLTMLTASALQNGVPLVAAMRPTEVGGGILLDPASGQAAQRSAPDQAVLRGRVRRLAQRIGLTDRPYRVAQALVSVPGQTVSHSRAASDIASSRLGVDS